MGWLNLFQSSGQADPEARNRIMVVLTQWAGSKSLVKAEIQEIHLHFQTVVSVKGDLIVLTKPEGLAERIKLDTHLRLINPANQQEILLEVVTPHVNMKSGVGVVVCRLPDQDAALHRDALRIDTSRFNNIWLHFPAIANRYKVLDISVHGVRFRVDFNAELSHFPVGRSISPVKLVASKYNLDLEELNPKVHKGLTVGCEINLSGKTNVSDHLADLVRYLEREEMAHIRNQA